MPAVKKSKYRAGVVGANGYAGLELCQILENHPLTELAALFVRDESWSLQSESLGVATVPTHPLTMLPDLQNDIDVVFFATPVEVSMTWIPQLLNRGTFVVDLSGAFRLPQAAFEKAYKTKHLCPELIEKAVYGLSSLLNPSLIQETMLVANPGCYPTSIGLALVPLLADRVIEPRNIVIDAKSGTTGAGRKPNSSLLLSEMSQNYVPYKVDGHQHFPEIAHTAARLGQSQLDFVFSTSLLPVERGICSAIFAKSDKTDAAIYESYQKVYAESALVHCQSWSERQGALSQVVRTPHTLINWYKDPHSDSLVIYSFIDNLLKGAASQAIENWNLKNGWKPETGLLKEAA